MASLPLAERELRVALRKLNPRRRRLVTAGWAVGITGGLILLAAISGSRSLGSNVHTVLLVFSFFALWSVPGRIAGAIAEERRNQTLGILFISGLSAMDIFIGKLSSAVLIAFNDLLVIFPLLALPFIMGGVSFELYIATICCLPNVLLFILAVSLFVSTVTKDEASAQTWTTLLLLVICGLAPAIWVGQKWFAGITVQSPWLALSPAYGVFLVFTKFSGASAHAFWMNWLVTLGWSMTLLIAAAAMLQRIWRSDENASQTQTLRSGWRRRLDAVFQRQRESNRWMLESNPALWTEISDQRPLKLAWTAIGVVVGIWLLGWAAWPAQWPRVSNFFITTTLLIFLVQVIQNYATAKRFAESRRDGAFELLLTTPLSVGEFVHGHLEGRRVQFRPVVFTLLVLELVMALAGLVVRPWTPSALFTYVVVWLALAFWTWTLLLGGTRRVRIAWAALNSARINFAMWNQDGKWGRIWVLYNIWNVSRGLRFVDSFPSGSPVEFIMMTIIVFIFCVFVIARREAENTELARLIDELRGIIREPIPDPDDPRYRKWKQPWNERFPWGPAAFQDRIIERAERRRQSERIRRN